MESYARGQEYRDESLNRPAYERVNEIAGKYGRDIAKTFVGSEHTYEGMYAAF